MAQTDNVTYNISIQAEQAVKELEALNAQATSWDAKITAVTAKVQQLSAVWGTSFKSTVGVLKNVDTELSNAGKGAGIFGQQVVGQLTMADGSVKNVTKSLSNIGFNQVAQEAESASRRTVRSIDAIRIALGAIVAMLVFQGVQAVITFFTNAINYARQFEGVLYNIQNAERIMSQQGVSIAPKDFQDMIDGLQKLVPMLSQLDATKAVGNLALFTKDLGYTKEQIGQLADAIGVLYVRNRSLGLSFEQVQSQVQTGLLTGRAQGIRDLGVSISESQIKNEALREGLVKTEQEFNNLTGDMQTNVKAQAMLGLILKSTASEQKNLSEYLKTTDATMGTASARWADFTRIVGTLISPMLKVIALFATEAFMGWIKGIQIVQPLFVNFISTIAAGYQTLNEIIAKPFMGISAIANTFAKFKSDNIKMMTQDLGDLSGMADTATGSAQQLTSALADMSKVDLTSLNNAMINLQESIAKLNREYAQNAAKYQQEYNTKISRMQEDYQISVQQTLQEFANRRADLEAQYRNQQLDAEAKYQEQMRELRSKYLYDLEDALRNRDARQVLRLQAQYKMDKESLTKNFENESAARARQYKTELEQLKRQEAQKLAEMAAAEALKEKRAAEDYAIEQAQRKQAYDDALADLKQSWKDRLDEEAQKIAEQLGVTGKGVDDIRSLLEKYYGAGGVFDGLYQYSYDSLVSKGSQMLAEMASIVGQYMALASAIGGSMVGTFPNNEPYRGGGGTYPPGGGGGNGGGGSKVKAKGGVDIANKPTTVTYGEAGPEAAIFLPLNKPATGLPMTGGGIGGGLNGLIRIALELSPDLEARIQENTLKEAANITTHVYRRRG